MDFTAEVRMGHTALLNIAIILVLATAAHGVYPAHLGLGKKRCRVTSGQQCWQPADSALLK